MAKDKIVILILCFCVFSIFAQNKNPLEVKKIILDNGLMVLLNEDHSRSDVYGVVAIKAGSKYDPPDATGVAHYLEHMLFKGTDKIGTIDFEKEKPILNKINELYDELAVTKDEGARQNIQTRINELANDAAIYQIPNEFSSLIQSIGGTDLNASTYEDFVMYYNNFPPQEIYKWLELYSERFINPVFRLFQSELETVYEEKNRAQDNSGRMLWTEFNKSFYKIHPYRRDALGETQNLKNPSLTKLYDFYNKYYVANNMVLIITGDFDADVIIPAIKEKFGRLKSGNVPVFPVYKEESFNGRELVVKKMSPKETGILGFRSVPENHPDIYALEVCNYLLYNSNKTGVLNKLQLENKLLDVDASIWANVDAGLNYIYFNPVTIAGTLQFTEKMILSEIDKLSRGKFSDETFETAKTNLVIQFKEDIENNKKRSFLMLDMFLYDEKWEDLLSFSDKIIQLKREDIVNAFNKYYSKNYLCFYSKIGTYEKEKLDKPAFKPIKPVPGISSEYAKKFKAIPSGKMNAKFIDFNNDVKVTELKPNVKLYYAKNDVNDIFSLEIRYGAGKRKIKSIGHGVKQMNEIGTKQYSNKVFKEKMEHLGLKYSFNYNEDYTNVTLNGSESNLIEGLKLLNDLLTNPKPDQARFSFNANNDILNRILFEKKDPKSVSVVLNEYLKFKEHSPYLKRPSVGEVLNMNADKMVSEFKKVYGYEMSIFYSGQKDSNVIKNILTENISIIDNIKPYDRPGKLNLVDYSKNTILFVDRKDIRQSQIYFYIKGDKYKFEDLAKIYAFNEYFGNGMSSIVFQEIREFRSLAYTANGSYIRPNFLNLDCRFEGYIGTQIDKTVEAVETMTDLIKNMPEKKERFSGIKDRLMKIAYNSKPSFRILPYSVENYMKMGFDKDPNEELIKIYEKLTFEDVLDFYMKNIKNKNIAICIVGNKSRIDMKRLAKIGDIEMISQNKLYNN